MIWPQWCLHMPAVITGDSPSTYSNKFHHREPESLNLIRYKFDISLRLQIDCNIWEHRTKQSLETKLPGAVFFFLMYMNSNGNDQSVSLNLLVFFVLLHSPLLESSRVIASKQSSLLVFSWSNTKNSDWYNYYSALRTLFEFPVYITSMCVFV